MVIVRETLEPHSGSHKKIIPFSLFCQRLYFSLQPWKLFAGGFSPLQQNLGIESEVFWWNVSVSERLWSDCVHAPFVFSECLVPETYWHECSKWISKMHMHVTMGTEGWSQAAELLLGDCVLYPVWAWKQCHVNYLNGHTPTVVVTTGTNFFATDLVRVRIPHDCEKILNYSSWKKYILFVQTSNRKES